MIEAKVEVLFEGLQPFMVGTFGGKTEKERALLDEANKRLLGEPAECDVVPVGPMVGNEPAYGWNNFSEPTGLHCYGDNHLRPEFKPLAEARAEVIDAINILGPFVNQRQMLGIDNRGRLAQGFIGVAVKLLFKVLEAVHAAEEVKE